MRLKNCVPVIAACALVLLNSCEKNSVIPGITSVSSTPGFDGTIDGEDYFFQEGTEYESGTYAEKLASQTGTGNVAAFESWVCKQSLPNEGVQITKGQLSYSGDKPEETQFKNFVVFSDNPFAAAGSKDGIIITYTDAAGNKWASNMGSANQDGSEFTIVSTKEETIFNDLYIRAYVKFSCKVYNAGGDVKNISNGRFVGRFNR